MTNTRDRAAVLLAVAAAVAVFWLGIAYGSRAATGADAFGYVSQAYLWLEGDLQLEQPLSKEFPWPHPELSFTPLGYRPGDVRDTIVPVYSPGVPLIMAAFHLAFGNCGPYYVSPVFAALLVLGTCVLAWRLTADSMIAAVAAILMAGSPAFLFNLMFPMSDIVTASLWTWAMALLTCPAFRSRPSPSGESGTTPRSDEGSSAAYWTAAAAGCVAGLAVIVRPNLVALALAGAVAAAWWMDESASPSRRALRVAAFAAGIVPAALFIAALNKTLYGSPLESGYGDASALYALSHLPTNVTQFATWLIESESVLVAAAFVPLFSKRLRAGWLTLRTGLPLGAFAAIAVASYLFYLPFDEWWFLRFLLPVFPLVFLFLAVTIMWFSRAAPVPPVLALLVILGLLGAYRGAFAATRDLLKLGYGEQRYVAVGQYIDRALPANAVILAMQHSGSVRYYSGRPTIRYDVFYPSRFAFVIEWLQARGYRPFILLEDWEEKRYRARLGNDTPLGRLQIRVLAEMTQPVKVRLYEPVPSRAVDPLPDVIVIRQSRTCVGPGGVWAR